MNDDKLVDKCVAGDPKGQQLLFDRFSPLMMGVVLRYVNDREKANDVLQDAFIKVFKNIKRYKKEGSLEGWIRRIVVNTALDQIRKNKKYQKHIEVDDISINLSKPSEAEEQLEAESLMYIIKQLPEGFKLVFNMYAIEGYSHKEIADKLGISESTSKSQYSRAKSTLRKLLKKYNIER